MRVNTDQICSEGDSNLSNVPLKTISSQIKFVNSKMSIIQDADGQLILIVRSIKLHKFRFYVGFEAKGYKFWLLDIGSVRYFLVSGSSSSLVTGDLVQLQLYAPPLPGLVRHSRY